MKSSGKQPTKKLVKWIGRAALYKQTMATDTAVGTLLCLLKKKERYDMKAFLVHEWLAETNVECVTTFCY